MRARVFGKKATRPCPCGYLGHPTGKCHCTPDQVLRYRGKISGPLLDRIDIHIEVPALSESELTSPGAAETTALVRERVQRARDQQSARQGKPNAQLGGREIERQCVIDAAAQALLKQAIARLGLSARAYHRVLKLARTIADLADEGTIQAAHVGEAIQYRRGLEAR
jgi:magnesium chelatase family protein